MADGKLSLPMARSFGETSRRDLWWVTPVAVFTILSAFIGYSTWAALQGNHYFYAGNGANYLSPFYSPEFWGDSPHALFGAKPAWWPWFVTPAVLILWAPAGFRFTCYYYRGAYYKAFWADPPSCAVGEPRKSYWGERFFPLIFQNAHRFFMYLAILFIVFLAWDFIQGFRFKRDDGSWGFGVGVGTLVLGLNVTLLSCYTFGCHSLRHLIGGRHDEMSKYPAQKKAYDCVSCLNRKHMLWAWCSLFGVAFADIYVRMCSMGVWKDIRII